MSTSINNIVNVDALIQNYIEKHVSIKGSKKGKKKFIFNMNGFFYKTIYTWDVYDGDVNDNINTSIVNKDDVGNIKKVINL